MSRHDRSLGGEDHTVRPLPENGGPLFPALSRASDPETSAEAAARVDSRTLCGRVLEALRASEGLTSLEVAERLAPEGVDPVAYLQSISPRFSNLRREGLARPTGERRNKRQVWRAV